MTRDELMKECLIERWSTGALRVDIKVTHQPTGICESEQTEGSRHLAQQRCLDRIWERLAPNTGSTTG